VFYVIDQNVKIFGGFVHHRTYFRQFSKKSEGTGSAKMLTHFHVFFLNFIVSACVFLNFI